jgi:FkbM family methyltransferase
MLDLLEFKHAGKSDKPTSWITDRIRSLVCSFLWPYFNRLLMEIEERANKKLVDEAIATQAQLSSRLASRIASAEKDVMATASRLGSLEKEVMATASRCSSVEKLLTEYKEKNLQLDDGTRVALPGSSLIFAAVKYGRFLLRHPDVVSQAILAGQYWDPQLKPIIERVGRQELVAIDAGSYLGFHAIHMARHFGQVYAFEPQTEIFEMLCTNILINGMKNIKAFNNALYDRDCYMRLAPASLQEIPVPFMGSTIDYDRIGNAAALTFEVADEKSAGSIRGLTIDSLNLENVGLIKIDAQGSEFYVLKGSTKTIARCRPVIVFGYEAELSRWHGWELAQCEEYFEGVHYDLKILAVEVEGKKCDYVATPALTKE